MRGLRRNTLLTPPERYTLAAQAADKLPRPLVRENHMLVYGRSDDELATRLVRVGAPLVRAVCDTRDAEDWKLIPDYISSGAALAFRVLERVIHPASRLYGVGNFRIEACGASGAAMTDPSRDARHRVDTSTLSPTRMYPLGDTRDDYWTAARIGLASEVASSNSTEKAIASAVRRAESGNLNDYAYAALAKAATAAQCVIDANLDRLEMTDVSAPSAFQVLVSSVHDSNSSVAYEIPF